MNIVDNIYSQALPNLRLTMRTLYIKKKLDGVGPVDNRPSPD